jgi:arylsulfatase A-like enzyme
LRRCPITHPNIVFIFADQLRYTAVGCNGNEVVRTPNIDRLAGEGVVFDRAFSGCPICSPYRGQLLTGRYSHSNGVVDNEYRLRPGEATLPMALRDAGYRSA